ncbi:hypothetical protein [Pseudomonas syringae]|uniref:hypothetical protein n=1 Tax=Pseudomonas syringae TaxID=317 RepID=UPI00035FF29A|nr:hypothetical protein [Pseudomonas syringae]
MSFKKIFPRLHWSSLGFLTMVAVVAIFVFAFPEQLNRFLGIGSLLSANDKLNGPNDFTMLIRAVLGMFVGFFTSVVVVKAYDKTHR